MDGQWVAAMPAEARGSWGQAKRCFWRTWPSLCPPGSQDVWGLQALAALQTAHSGWSLVCSRLLAVWSHLSGVGRATFICCLLVSVGASLAVLWGDSLRVFLLLLLHLLYNFPDLALCSLQWREGRGGHREDTIPVLRPRRRQRVWDFRKVKLDAQANFTSPQAWQSRAEFLSTSPEACQVQGRGQGAHRSGRGRN